MVESELLEAARPNHLVAITELERTVGVAAVDASTGQVELLEIDLSPALVGQVMLRLAPAEVLLAEEAGLDALVPTGTAVARLEAWRFEPERGRQRALQALGVASLRGFDCDDLGPALGALGAALDYLQRNRLELPGEVIRLRRSRPGTLMHLDAPTLHNLEVLSGDGPGGRGLLGLVDRTLTPMGARALRAWLAAPLVRVDHVNERLAAVEELGGPAQDCGTELRQVRDLERLTTRTAQGHSQPRDLGAIRDSLPALEALRGALAEVEAPLLSQLLTAIAPEAGLYEVLARALEESLPPSAAAGGYIRAGYDDDLDQLRGSIHGAREWIAGLEATEREASGIKGLKVGFNRVFGYYLEVSNANRVEVPGHYQRRQTLANAERYITPELKQKESLVLNGEQAIAAREKELLAGLAAAVVGHARSLLQSAEAVGRLDALLSLAAAAAEHRWTRPEVGDGYGLEIRAGRHPLVEAALGPGQFVANDTQLGEDGRLMLLTGPNMAGKSTYLRQVGLIVLLAQAGSYVPAESARVGVVDRIFTRIGAHDAISLGLSTFMVEMVETASILHHASPRSLVVIDEIGRGTSTYDGMSIAQAVLEQLHDSPALGCKTLFATHFHELTGLADRLPALRNHRVEVSEDGGVVTFLHRIVPGGADRSYGIHVAEIAGLPPEVTDRARDLLAALEDARPLVDGTRATNQMSLPLAAVHPVVRELERMAIESLSPLEALNRLAALKAMGESSP